MKTNEYSINIQLYNVIDDVKLDLVAMGCLKSKILNPFLIQITIR